MLNVNDPSTIIVQAAAGVIAYRAHNEGWTKAQIIEAVMAKLGQWNNLNIEVSYGELSELVAAEMISLRCPERR